MKNERNVNDFRVNDRIKIIMKVFKLNQSQLSKVLDVSAGRVSNIINYQNRPDSILLERLLNEFRNVNARWLITGEGEMLNDQNNLTNLVAEEPVVGYGTKKDDAEVSQLKEIIELQKYKISNLESKLKEKEI